MLQCWLPLQDICWCWRATRRDAAWRLGWDFQHKVLIYREGVCHMCRHPDHRITQHLPAVLPRGLAWVSPFPNFPQLFTQSSLACHAPRLDIFNPSLAPPFQIFIKSYDYCLCLAHFQHKLFNAHHLSSLLCLHSHIPLQHSSLQFNCGYLTVVTVTLIQTRTVSSIPLP